MKTCKKFQVTGRVQGVWFRDSTRREALRLGLTGYAHNLSDGSVEVLACGDSSAVAKLAQWLHSGPRMARVDSVRELKFVGESPPTFSIG